MKELFKNKTKCTQKEYDKFLELQIEEFGVSELIKQLLWIAFFIFCIVLSIISKEYILLFISLLGVLIYIWFEYIRPTRTIKQQKLIEEFTNTYKFYKTYFTIKSHMGVSKIFYFKIYRVIETNTHFYIYISRENAALVSKKGFIDSTPEEFKKFIHKRTMLKYKTKLEL